MNQWRQGFCWGWVAGVGGMLLAHLWSTWVLR